MDRLNNGLYISIGGTLTVMGLYAGYRQRKERRERRCDLPTVKFDYRIAIDPLDGIFVIPVFDPSLPPDPDLSDLLAP